jgi:hypothetical protein
MSNVFSFTLQVANNSNIMFGSNGNNHRKARPTDNEDLVRWATEEFGGVTSFTTIQNPTIIASTGREGKTLSDTYNVPQTYTTHTNSLFLM